MNRYRSAAILALAVVGVLVLAGPVAAGKQMPFRGMYEGSFTQTPIPGTPTSLVVARGAGEATMLGHFSFDFPLTVNIVLQTGSGTYTFTAADGDKVFADVIAQSSLLPNGLRHVVETATITGGTGRFARATGSYIGERLLDRATGDVIGFFDGTISLRHGGTHGDDDGDDGYDD